MLRNVELLICEKMIFAEVIIYVGHGLRLLLSQQGPLTPTDSRIGVLQLSWHAKQVNIPILETIMKLS